MQKDEYLHVLKSNHLYQSLDPQELDTLITYAKLTSFTPGQVITKQGNKSNGIYIILEGRISISARVLGEGTLHLASLEQGNVFGSSSIIVDGHNATSAIAETEVRCLLITRHFFEMLAYFHPGTKYKIVKESILNTGTRLKSLADKIKEAMSNTEMATQSFFSGIIKSLVHHTSPANYEEMGLNLNELQQLYPLTLFNNKENHFLSHSQLIKAANQCALIEENEKDLSCYLVLKGAVQSSLIKNNKCAKISILGPMSFFCSFSFADELLPSFINYTTCERAVLLKLEKSRFDQLKNNDIETWYKVYDLVCASIVVQGRYMEKLDIRINSEIYNR